MAAAPYLRFTRNRYVIVDNGPSLDDHVRAYKGKRPDPNVVGQGIRIHNYRFG